MPALITTLGPKHADELGLILPHEHLFANFGSGEDFGIGAELVAEVMLPAVLEAQAAGVTALVDATAIGGARRVDILKMISERSGLPIVVATGIFKEPFKRQQVEQCGEDELCEWLLRELNEGIQATGVRAGWIKLSAADDGLLEHEKVLLHAAARAGIETNATIGSHTVRGRVALDQLDIIESAGHAAGRFIWIHAQMEPDTALHIEVARRGAWVEYDAIDGGFSDDQYIGWVLRLLDAGLGDHVLLSHDRVGYNPAQSDGGERKPYSYLSRVFLPRLRAAGADDATLHRLTHANPFRAYAR